MTHRQQQSRAGRRSSERTRVLSMRKLLIGSVAFTAMIAAPALASDLLPAKKSLYMQAPAPAWNWTGWYVGGNLGWGWGHTDSSLSLLDSGTRLSGSGDSPSFSGVTGGAQLGYNWQAGYWVF